jgi:hypothetical protein
MKSQQQWAVASFTNRLNGAKTPQELKHIRNQLDEALRIHPRGGEIRDEISRNTAKGRQP